MHPKSWTLLEVHIRNCGVFLIFRDEGVHFVEYLFHILDQLELRSASVHVLSRAMRSEIYVAVEIVRQKAHSALIRH